MRLIDADKLIEAINNQDNWLGQMELSQMANINIYSLVNTMPTVEPDVNCSHCDYFKFSKLFAENIAKLMADYNIETVDDLINVINQVKDELKEADDEAN